MNLEEKLTELNIVPVTDAVYHQHLKHYQLRGMDVSNQEYYKMYGDTPMFYSEDYINSHTLDELRERDKINRRMFCPPLIDRIKRKIDVLQMKKYKYLNKF